MIYIPSISYCHQTATTRGNTLPPMRQVPQLQIARGHSLPVHLVVTLVSLMPHIGKMPHKNLRLRL